MNTPEVLTIIGSILVPMLAGFGWIIHQINQLRDRIYSVETRITVIETVLSMMGMPAKSRKNQIEGE